MNRLRTSLLLASTLSLAGTVPLSAAAKESQKPNVVILYVDDMGIGDVGYTGGKVADTPHIDALANQGKVFSQYYTAAPVSSPSRVGATTGCYPIKYKINTFLSAKRWNRETDQNDYLVEEAPSMARAFSAAGYHTGHFGKWHMGGGRDVKEAPAITKYGFDEYISTYESPDADPKLTSTNWIWAPTDEVRRWSRTEYFINKSLEFIDKHKGEPCFINLWPDDMHTPWVPDDKVEQNKKEWSTKESFRPVMEAMDKEIGRFVEELKKRDLMDNTIFVFTSDNGPSPSFKRERTLGMRGCKNSLYEGGINMPFFITYGDKIAKGKDNQTQFCSVDLYPTLCAMAGIPVESGWNGDGEDLSKAIYGKKSVERKDALKWSYGHNEKFKRPGNNDSSPHLAIRKGEWKLLCNSLDDVVELYNLTTDPNEATNVAANNPAIVSDMKGEVMAWWEENKPIAQAE